MAEAKQEEPEARQSTEKEGRTRECECKPERESKRECVHVVRVRASELERENA